MKDTRNPIIRPTLHGLVLALAVVALSSYVARAVPYASGVSNTAGNTWTFVLNEDATAVTVLRNGASPVTIPPTRGIHSFDMSGFSTFSINVTNNAPVGWVLTSSDSNSMCLYGSPRGVAVSQVSSNLSTFGRIYVADSAAPGGAAELIRDATTLHYRTNIGKGIYVLNADQSDCVGQAVIGLGGTNIYVNPASNGIPFNLTSPTTSSPFHLGFGPDNKLYVNLFGTIDATTCRSTNADCFGFEVVLSGVGESANAGVHTDSSSKPIVRGSTVDSSLNLFMLDGAYSGHFNSLAQWTIGGASLPWNTAPTFVGIVSPYTGGADVTCDVDIGLDGRYFTMFDRSAGTDYASILEWDTDGSTLLFDSFTFYGVSGTNPDPLRNAVACALSPDGKTFSFLRLDNSVMMLSLTNAGGPGGVIDPSTLFTLTAPATTSVTAPATGNGRQMCYDAAGNIYTVGSGQARLRAYAPGGFTVATTTSAGSFTVTKPANNVSVTASTPITTMDTTQPSGVFTLTRTGNTASQLAVGYTLTGTATNGVQYTNLPPQTVVFKAGDTSTNVYVQAKPYTPAGPTRSVIMTLNGSNSYTPASPLTATVWIIDTNHPAVVVAVHDAQFYERTNDYARFTLTRWGDTNATLSQVNVTYGGTASQTTPPQFYGWASTNFNPGDITQNVYVFPIHDGLVTGPLTVTATVGVAGDGSYDVGTPSTSGTVTRVDADDPPETVLWSDNLQTDTSANWTYLYAAAPDPTVDYDINALPPNGVGTWPFDYSALAVPPAPHNTDPTSTKGLYMTVNKNDAIAASAALNFYPNGQSFSGNYALRFDMFLIENDTASTTEYALFGLNHSGTKTNWFRNSTTTFVGVDATGWNFDGVFYDAESDGADLGQYVGYSSPTTAGINPTPITPGVGAEALTGVFKSPPWTVGSIGGGASANVYGSATPIWADVELRQVNGVISWYINHTLVFAYTNTTGYTSGNIMLGYEDGFDSVGSSGGAVIYANARVISLARPIITHIVDNAGSIQITFTANASDVVGQFVLQTAPVVNGTYADTSSTITSLGGGAFKAVKPAGAGPTFYRIRRIE